MRRPLQVSRTPALAGDLTLLLWVHRREPSSAAFSLIVCHAAFLL